MADDGGCQSERQDRIARRAGVGAGRIPGPCPYAYAPNVAANSSLFPITGLA